MKAFTYNIPIYRYGLMLISISKEDIEDENKLNTLKEYLSPYFLNCYIEETIETAKSGNEEAITRSEGSRSFCIFYNINKRKEEIYGHEKRHVEDRILRICGINDAEAAGYLAGHLSNVFADFDNMTKENVELYKNGTFNFKTSEVNFSNIKSTF